MRRSIGLRVTLNFMLFSVVIIGIIGLSVKFILPGYYTNRQLAIIDEVKTSVYDAYDPTNPEVVVPYLEALKQEVGGELYTYTEQGTQIGMGNGKGRNAVLQNNSEKFVTGKDVTDYTYVNKVGLDIFVLGVLIEDEYLVYEVSLQTLDNAVDVILEFFWILLIIVMGVAMFVSIYLSRNIAKPIKALNVLAKDMKSKKIRAVMVTESKDEIGELNKTLNELYEELLSSIYNLETELKKERNAENLKKRFLAQATHELKTPIAIIKGYAEVLYDGMYKDEEDRDRYLKNIYDESEAISHLIIDVLDYTKMETGNYSLDAKEVMVKPFYEDLLQRFKGYVEEKHLKADFSVQLPGRMTQSLDCNRVEQVLRNLIGNGVEHSHSFIRVKVTQLGEKVKIEVANDGLQIDEEDLPFIFDSFYKKKGKRSGTGLGLAIVKEIVQLHQGSYRAENTQEGVRFIVII